MSGIRSLYRGTALKGYASTISAPIYVDSDDNRVKLVPAGSGTTEVVLQEAGGAGVAEVLTAARVLTAADSGKTFFLALAGGFTVTLPAIAMGLTFKFFVQIAPTTAYIVITHADNRDTMAGQIYSSAGADEDSETAFTADQIDFVANTSVIGDSADFTCDGTNWYARGWTNAAGGMTVTG